jgi:hypothetical protein
MAEGGSYVGEWKEDLPNGKGTLTKPDGSRYIGNFRNGKPAGQGLLVSPDGKETTVNM